MYVFYALSNHLLLSDFFITGNNSEVSSSTIWHTHVAKGVMGQIIALFSKTNFTTMDNGGAYIGLIPSSVFLFGSLLFVIIILQAIVYFATSFKTFLIDKNNRQKIFIILGYIIISFSLIKRSIDGGMLNPDFIVSMIFIILFVLRSKGMPLTRYYYLISAVGITLLFIGLYLDFFSYGSSLGIASIAVIILLYNLILYASEKKLSLKFLIPIIILFISGWWMASSRDRNIYDYSRIVLQKGQQIYTYNEKSKQIETSKIEQPESIAQISKQLGKNITYAPITVPGITCMVSAPRSKISARLITREPIYQSTFASSPYLKIESKTSIAIGKKWQTNITASVDPCLPDALAVINGELEESSINNYILVSPLLKEISND